MSTQNDSKAEQQLRRELLQEDEQIRALTTQLAEAKKRKSKKWKAYRILSGESASKTHGRIAPTLKHVNQAIRLVMKGKNHLHLKELESRALDLLKAEDRLSEQGLALRLKQGLAKLKVDPDGLVVASPIDVEETPEPKA